MVVSNNTLCPHCGRLATEGGEATDDHIFPEAFGGKETIRACKWCNNGVGSGVEGKFLRPQSRFAVLLQNSGLPHPKVRVNVPDLGDFFVDLETGEHIALFSHKVETDVDGTEVVKWFGSPDKVAEHQAAFEQKHGAPQEIIGKDVGSPDTPPKEGFIHVSDDMTDLRRFLAKTALCALTYLQGDPFIESALASWLRAVLDAPREWPSTVKRSPRPDPDGEEAATRSFDTSDINTKFQAELARRGIDQVDVSGVLATLLIGPSSHHPNGPRTFFVMSLLGEVLLTGLLAPGVPANMHSSLMLVKRLKEPMQIVDLARGLPNGYEY